MRTRAYNRKRVVAKKALRKRQKQLSKYRRIRKMRGFV